MGDTDRIKILLVLLVGVFILFVLGLAPITVAGEHQDGAINDSSGVEIDPEVQELTGEQQVIIRLEPLADTQPSPTELQAHAERTQGSVLTQIDSIRGVTVEKRLWIVNGLVVTVDGDDVGIEQIARIDGVTAIHANPTLTLDYEIGDETGEVTPETHTGMPSFDTRSFASTVSTDTSWALDQIGAPDAWTEYGTKGGGVKVAVLDTGIEVEHDDLELYTEDASDPTYPGGWTVIDSFGAPKDDPGEPFDNYGHGTATSGNVIAGDGGGQYQGVAPNADLLHANVGPSGSSSFSRIAGGIEWAIENNADVISISWGSEGYDSRYIDPIRNAQNSGVSVAVSVGNSGDGTSTSPGNDYDSISVGASEIDRDIATFSSGERIVNGDTYGSSAPSDWPDAYTVPKVVAPGRSVETTVPGNGYTIVDGTSFAAPNVAGAIALVISATDGNHTPEEIQQALVETASHPDGDNAQDTRYGHGIIDVPAAIEYLKGDSEPEPAFTVTDASLGESTILEGESVDVTATVENSGDADGTFTAELQEDGTTVATTDVTVAAGSTETVTFTRTYDTAGSYDLAVSATTAGTLTVEEATAAFAVSGASLSDSTILEGDTAETTATVENTGDAEGQFTAEFQLTDTSGQTTTRDTTTVTLGAGESTTVTLADTVGTTGTYDADVSGDPAGTLTVEQPATFAVSDASLAAETIDEDGSVDVAATVENTGDRSGTFTAELLVDGTQQSTADVEVPGGGTTTVTFTELFEDPGEYTIDVNEARAGTLTVEETVAEFTVSGATLADDTILEGETAEATATVENVGDEEGQFTAAFRLTDASGQTTTRDMTTVTLGAGESTTVTLADTVGTAGEYDATVGGESTGTLTVEQPATFGITDTALSASTITEGETVTVEATVENTGDRDGEFTADLLVDGSVAGTTTVTVTAGTTETVSFDEGFDTPGEYAIAVDDATVGTLTVEGTTPEFVVSDATLTDSTILEGETAEVTATVANVGNTGGEFTAEFRLPGAPTTVRDTAAVTLAAGESTTVTLADTVGTAGTYDAEVSGEPAGASSADVSGASAGTLTVESPADIAVTDATLQADSIGAGESVEVTATVENTGDRDGTFTAELRVDGTVEETTDVEVPGGETATVTFEPTFPEAGEHTVGVNDARAGTVTVESVDPAQFEVSNAALDDATILAGDTAQVSATVENVGDEAGTYTATFRADGDTVDSQDLALDSGKSERVTLTATFDDAGTYDVTVSGADVGTLTVERPATFAVVSADLDTHTITAEETATVTATVENVGDRDGTHEVTLVENGEAVATTTVSVPATETRTVTFERTYDEPGSYDFAVDGTAAGTLTVTEVDPAAFLVEGVSGGAGSTSAGEPVEITATVTNTGEERGTAPVRLLIDGVERDAAELTLDADENRTVRLRWEPGADDAGEYTAIVESPTDSETTPVTVRGSPSFAVDAPEANAPVTAGEQLQVEATVENTGWNGTQRVRLLVNGTERDATELALDGGESRTVTLSWDTDEGDAGTHDLVVASGTATATVTARVTPANGERPPPVVGGEPPRDLTGDGVYEDIDGDGEFTVGDVQQFFQHRDSEAVRDNAEFFDLTGDGQVSVGDVQRLFMEFMAAS